MTGYSWENNAAPALAPATPSDSFSWETPAAPQYSWEQGGDAGGLPHELNAQQTGHQRDFNDELIAKGERPGASQADRELASVLRRSGAGHITNAIHAGNVSASPDAIAAGAVDSMSVGTAPYITATLDTGLDALSHGGHVAVSFHDRVAHIRDTMRRMQEERPISYMGGQMAGMVPLTAATGGVGDAAAAGKLGSGVAWAANNPVARAAAGRGWAAFLGKGALGATGGAAYGGAYNLADSGGDWNAAAQGAEQGALLGGVAPPLFEGIGLRNPFLRAGAGGAVGALVAQQFGKDPMEGAAIGATGAGIGRPVLGAISGKMGNSWRALFGGLHVDEGALDRFDNTLGEARMSTNDFEGHVADARGRAITDQARGLDPIDQRAADLHPAFGEEVERLTTMPGGAARSTSNIRDQRSMRLADAVHHETPGVLGINETPLEALDRIRGEGGDIKAAAEALGMDGGSNSTMGSRLLAMRPEDIEHRIQNVTSADGAVRPTTQEERYLYKVAAINEVRRRVEEYVSAPPGQYRNAAEVFESGDLANRLRTVFNGGGAKITEFLKRMTERAEGLRRSEGWAQTAGNNVGERGGASRAMGLRFAAHAATGGVPGVIHEVGRMAANAAWRRFNGHQNNALTGMLLGDLSHPGNEAYFSKMTQMLRQLDERRRLAGRNAFGQGAVNAMGVGSARQEQNQ